jgi:hypothetical protein
MAVKTLAGTTLALSAGVPATFNSAGYAALTYTTLGEVIKVGPLGRKYTVTLHKPIGSSATQKLKGSFDEGGFSADIGVDSSDAGQTLAKAGLIVNSLYSVKLWHQGSGLIQYFQGLITGFTTNMGGVDDIDSASIDIAITTSSTGVGIVEV